MPKRKKQSIETSPTPPKSLLGELFYGVQLDEEQQQFAEAIWCGDYDIIFVNAKAGSGKTFISIGVANLLVQYGIFDSIVYIVSPYGERKQGWLPGDIQEKSAVYFDPVWHALIDCNVNPNIAISSDIMANQKNGDGYITCITDTFLRGTTLENCVVILDEAQNYTAEQLKKTLTRVGKNVRVVVVGHNEQCDLDKPSTSGFLKYMKHFEGMERCAVCALSTNYRGWISQHADNFII